MSKIIEKFFDEKASSWDDKEMMSQEELSSFLDAIPFKEKMRCLDVGCGTGIISDILFKKTKNKVTAIDLSSEMIKIAKKKYPKEHVLFLTQDIFEFDTKRKFDLIVLFNCYPHFLSVDRLVLKIYDLLDVNGIFVIAHSMGKAKLNEHHQGMNLSLFRDLKSGEEEWKYFQKYFDLVSLIDEDSRYFIIGRKK